jgi:Tfp pilus tip-associated adhesin PilY1
MPSDDDNCCVSATGASARNTKLQAASGGITHSDVEDGSGSGHSSRRRDRMVGSAPAATFVAGPTIAAPAIAPALVAAAAMDDIATRNPQNHRYVF